MPAWRYLGIQCFAHFEPHVGSNFVFIASSKDDALRRVSHPPESLRL